MSKKEMETMQNQIENLQKIVINLLEVVRDIGFDTTFCLEVLKQDDDISNFYERCNKKYQEELLNQLEKENIAPDENSSDTKEENQSNDDILPKNNDNIPKEEK